MRRGQLWPPLIVPSRVGVCTLPVVHLRTWAAQAWHWAADCMMWKVRLTLHVMPGKHECGSTFLAAAGFLVAAPFLTTFLVPPDLVPVALAAPVLAAAFFVVCSTHLLSCCHL